MENQTEDQTEEKKTPNVKWWHGCLVIIVLSVIVGTCISLVSDTEPETTAMEEWQIAQCGSESYVFGIYYMTYGSPDHFGHDGRFGWSSEIADPSSFPKWYYYSVGAKNAFGTRTITEFASMWDYNCNLIAEDNRLVGFE